VNVGVFRRHVVVERPAHLRVPEVDHLFRLLLLLSLVEALL
jgi:hypothetical protein